MAGQYLPHSASGCGYQHEQEAYVRWTHFGHSRPTVVLSMCCIKGICFISPLVAMYGEGTIYYATVSSSPQI